MGGYKTRGILTNLLKRELSSGILHGGKVWGLGKFIGDRLTIRMPKIV